MIASPSDATAGSIAAVGDRRDTTVSVSSGRVSARDQLIGLSGGGCFEESGEAVDYATHEQRKWHNRIIAPYRALALGSEVHREVLNLLNSHRSCRFGDVR